MTICQSQKDQAKQAVAVPPAHGYRRVRVAGGQTQATASSPDTMPAPELNLSMAAWKDTQGEERLQAPSDARLDIPHGLDQKTPHSRNQSRPMLLNLPENSGVGSCAGGLMRTTESRRPFTAKSSPRISIANAVGGSVVPTNARPKSVSSMGKTPCRVKP